MMINGTLAKVCIGNGVIETTSAREFYIEQTSYSGTISDNYGGTLYINNNTLNCLHINGYNDYGVLNLEIVRDELYPDEEFFQITEINKLAYNQQSMQWEYDIKITTIFGTLVWYRVSVERIPPNFEHNTATFRFHLIDYGIDDTMGKSIPSFTLSFESMVCSGFDMGAGAARTDIQIKLDGGSNFVNKQNTKIMNTLLNRQEAIAKQNILCLQTYFSNTKPNFSGWGGTGSAYGDSVETRSSNGKITTYKRKKGKNIETLVHNNAISAGLESVFMVIRSDGSDGFEGGSVPIFDGEAVHIDDLQYTGATFSLITKLPIKAGNFTTAVFGDSINGNSILLDKTPNAVFEKFLLNNGEPVVLLPETIASGEVVQAQEGCYISVTNIEKYIKE